MTLTFSTCKTEQGQYSHFWRQCILHSSMNETVLSVYWERARPSFVVFSAIQIPSHLFTPHSKILLITLLSSAIHQRESQENMFSWRKSFKITEINQPLCFSDYFEWCFISLHHIPLLSPISCVNLFILTDIITLVKVLNFTLTWAPENYTSWLQFFRLPKHHFLLLIVKRKYFCLLHTHLNALNGPALCQNGLAFAWYFIIIS